jgi:hypothetical protein
MRPTGCDKCHAGLVSLAFLCTECIGADGLLWDNDRKRAQSTRMRLTRLSFKRSFFVGWDGLVSS